MIQNLIPSPTLERTPPRILHFRIHMSIVVTPFSLIGPCRGEQTTQSCENACLLNYSSKLMAVSGSMNRKKGAQIGLVAMVALVIGEYLQPPRPVVVVLILATWAIMFLIWRRKEVPR